MKFLLFYDLAADGLPKVQAAFARHSERLREFHARGVLLMAGPVGTPPAGALAVFTDEGEARAFAEGDPFVTEGAVVDWRIEPWAEGLAA